MSTVARDRQPAHVATIEELRRILRDDPEAFCRELDTILECCTDEVTRTFWVNVQELAREDLR